MEHGGGQMSESFGEPRAGQEAAKLLAAAQEWLRTSAPHVAPLDADGRTCACPLCRMVAGVRDADPVALGTWVDAAVAAATAALAQAGETLAPSSADGGGSGDVDDEPGAQDTDGDRDDEVAPGERGEAAARQDDDRARGIRRIPLEHTEPGDLDG